MLSRHNVGVTDLLTDLYFEHFHPVLPIMHKSTFTTETAHPAMLKVMAAIGALYLDERARLDRLQRDETSSQDLWKSGVAELEQLVGSFSPIL